MVSHGSNTVWPWWRRTITGLSAVALMLSIYLSWHHLADGPVIGCGGGSSCDQVLSSRWSTIGGVIPVSGLAMGAYLTMLIASLFIGPATVASIRRTAWNAMLVLAGAIAGSAIWFFVLQEWFIGAFCPYCMTTHITGLILVGLVIGSKPSSFSAASGPFTGNNHLAVIGLGLALSGFMAILQVAITPSAVYVEGDSPQHRSVIDPHKVPLVGSPDAPYVVNLLFDYQCSHCQRLHFMLDAAVSQYDGKLAFVLCPSPLSSKCNPFIPTDTDESNMSCDLANVGMAVWVADREAFTVFNRWMFSLESGDHWVPRSIDAAQAKAAELIGQEALDTAFADPWIDQYIQTIVQTYAQTGNAVPKLVYGSRWVVPELESVHDLVYILQNSLAVPKP